MEAAIRVCELRKSIRVGFWGRRIDILHGFSFFVPAGCIFGFIGLNGAGKSTTIKHLVGAARPTSGSVELFGVPPRDRAARRRFGYLPELPSLPGTLKPVELLSLHARLAGLAPDVARRRIDEVLERVGLLEAAGRRIQGFSKGMQQRVGLALALLAEPDLLILDEPMSGLDPMGRHLVREILLERKRNGQTVFFSSHILPDVEALCDEIAVLHRGHIVTQGPLDEAMKQSHRGHEIRFRTKADVPDTVHALGHVERRGASWALLIEAERDPLEAALRLREAGCEVERLEAVRASLEDHIVTLLEGEDRREAAP